MTILAASRSRRGNEAGLPAREALSTYLSKLDLEWDFAQYLWLPISRANDNDPVAPNRPPSRTVQSGANYAFASRRRAIAALSSMP